MPNIAALADEGVVLEQHYSQVKHSSYQHHITIKNPSSLGGGPALTYTHKSQKSLESTPNPLEAVKPLNGIPEQNHNHNEHQQHHDHD